MKIIGKYTYGNPNIFSWGEGTKVVIGNFCSIAANCNIYRWKSSYRLGHNISIWPYKSKYIQ